MCKQPPIFHIWTHMQVQRRTRGKGRMGRRKWRCRNVVLRFWNPCTLTLFTCVQCVVEMQHHSQDRVLARVNCIAGSSVCAERLLCCRWQRCPATRNCRSSTDTLWRFSRWRFSEKFYFLGMWRSCLKSASVGFCSSTPFRCGFRFTLYLYHEPHITECDIYLLFTKSVLLSLLSIYLSKKSRLWRHRCRSTTRAPNNVS